jgi:hypothetical protein
VGDRDDQGQMQKKNMKLWSLKYGEKMCCYGGILVVFAVVAKLGGVDKQPVAMSRLIGGHQAARATTGCPGPAMTW